MRGPMLRFAIVAIILLLLVVFYATRLGEEPATESEPPSEATSETTTVPGAAPVAETVSEDREREDWFPDLTDRNDVPGIDLGATLTRDTFGCDLQELADHLGVEDALEGEEGEQRIARLLETFALSGDAELQLAGSHLTIAADGGLTENQYDYGQMASIERAYQSDPMHPLVLWNAASACSADATTGFCADPQVRANIQTVLGNNGEYWALVAEQRYNRGDQDGALDALRRAAVAPEFDNYFMANIRMFQRAFSMIPDTNYTVQTLGAYALSNTIVEPGIGMACGAEVEARPEWLDACLAVARRYESDGRSISQQQWGARTQYRLLGFAGQREEAEAALSRHREIRDFRRNLDEDIVVVMLTDERVMAQFLEELEVSDERSAMYFVRDEVERLKQDPTYHPCPPEEFPGATD